GRAPGPPHDAPRRARAAPPHLPVARAPRRRLHRGGRLPAAPLRAVEVSDVARTAALRPVLDLGLGDRAVLWWLRALPRRAQVGRQMSSDDGLKGFKISDQVRQRVDRPGAPDKAAKGKPAAQESVGFPRVEALVGADEPDLSGLATRMSTLQELAASGSMKEKAGA